jgi:ring-1,2-phenylacetyl-CoA epoxidase subunit PaaD
MTVETIRDILEEVTDPEIPVLTIGDMGIIRDIRIHDDGAVEVVITPTYSGCPAMDMIEVNIKAALQDNGIAKATVTSVLSPAWTTDWISREGRRKLREYGIAPPVEAAADKGALFADEVKVDCPHCGSNNTRMISNFGSTPCKAQYQCKDCLEPFDYFKCH